MSFLALAKNLASVGIGISGDIARPLTLRRIVASGYDVLTDAPATTVTDFVTKGVVTRPKVDEDDDSATLDITRRFLIAALDLATVPLDKDLIVDDGKIYEIRQIKTDPAGALWIISGREP